MKGAMERETLQNTREAQDLIDDDSDVRKQTCIITASSSKAYISYLYLGG